MAKMTLRTILLATLLGPLPAQAQTAPAKQDAPLVVTGVRATNDEIATFVDAFTVASPSGRLARFEFAVCPLVMGLDDAQKAEFADRIRAVAKAAGVPVAKPGCDPNVVAIVTPDKKALIEDLMRRHPDTLGDLAPRQIRAMANSPEPAAAWHIGGPTLGADGRKVDTESAGFAVHRTTEPVSRITFATRPQFAAAVVVLDRHALDGLTIDQVADYAAMRTLIETDPARLGKSSAPTILKVLTAPMGSPTPPTLTDWDLGVLRGFYASNPNVTAAAQRSAVRKGVRKQLGVD